MLQSLQQKQVFFQHKQIHSHSQQMLDMLLITSQLHIKMLLMVIILFTQSHWMMLMQVKETQTVVLLLTIQMVVFTLTLTNTLTLFQMNHGIGSTTQFIWALQKVQQFQALQLESEELIIMLILSLTSFHIKFWDLKLKTHHSSLMLIRLLVQLLKTWSLQSAVEELAQSLMFWAMQHLFMVLTTQVSQLMVHLNKCTSWNLFTLVKPICLTKHIISIWTTLNSHIKLVVHTFTIIMQLKILIRAWLMVQMTSQNMFIQQPTTQSMMLFQWETTQQITSQQKMLFQQQQTMKEASWNSELTLFITQLLLILT